MTSGRANTRAISSRVSASHKVLRTAVLGILLPLLLLLWFQYRWLQDLQETSAIARQSALESYLSAIGQEVKYQYLGIAERALSLPPSLLGDEAKAELEEFFGSQVTPVVQRFFVVDFAVEGQGSLRFFDSQRQELFVPTWNAEFSSAQAAVAPWWIEYKKRLPITRNPVQVDERDKAHRMILKPVLDSNSQLVGLAGIILDETYFRNVILPRAITGALPEFRDQENLQVRVRDGNRRWTLGVQRAWGAAGFETASGPDATTESESIRKNLSFVFRDWQVMLTGVGSATEAWARSNFLINVSLTMALSLLAIGGISLLLRATRRELQLSELKNEFVSNVSHELRTPLSSIRVFGELLRRGKVKDQQKIQQYGEFIDLESRRLTQLINNILDFSSIESGRKKYLLAVVDLCDVVRPIVESWQLRSKQQGFKLEASLHSAPMINADRDAIGQAIFNLLDNAVKYSGDSRRVDLRVDSNVKEAIVEVEDHGIGIATAEQSEVFDRFHRVGNQLTHDVKGSGLGLSLVQHIATAHGGRVTVRSKLGTGSIFALHLPLAHTGNVERTLKPTSPESNS